MERDFEELLVKARFEEARIREFSRTPHSGTSSNAKLLQSPKAEGESRRNRLQSEAVKSGGILKPSRGACFSCGSTDHLIKNCGRGAPAEARGKVQP